jgi:hypothetical protein
MKKCMASSNSSHDRAAGRASEVVAPPAKVRNGWKADSVIFIHIDAALAEPRLNSEGVGMVPEPLRVLGIHG